MCDVCASKVFICRSLALPSMQWIEELKSTFARFSKIVDDCGNGKRRLHTGDFRLWWKSPATSSASKFAVVNSLFLSVLN